MTIQNLVGQVLGQYELRELLGVGGMAAVYRGYQLNLERAVAVKVLSQALGSDTAYIERFYREAKTSGALEHAHIVPVYDYGVQGDISYVVMRLLTGGTLSERIAARANSAHPLPSLGEVSSLLSQIGSALDYAHSHGVIHRDIKPSNIMFDNQGTAYVVDFGIAKLVDATNALTGTGTSMGTPSYMPPEQWRSEELTPAADQYALAVTIYLLVTGRVPFDASTPYGLMNKHMSEMPTPLHVQRPDVPAELNQVIERALAKEPGDRFPSVTAFAQAFDQAIRGHTGEQTRFFTTAIPPKVVTAPSAGTPEAPAPASTGTGIRSDPPMHKNPVIWGIGLLLLLILVILFVLLRPENGESSQQEVNLAQTQSALALTQAAVVAIPTISALDMTQAALALTQTAVATVLPTETATSEATEESAPTKIRTSVPTQTPRPTTRPARTPTPTDSSQPTEVAQSGRMVVINNPVSVRTDPSPDAREIGLVRAGGRLAYLETSEDGKYYRVRYAGHEGWVYAAFATLEGVEETEPAPEAGQTVVIRNHAPVRAEPSPDAPALGKVQPGDRLPYLETSEDAKYYQVEFEGEEGWVYTAFADLEEE